MRAWEREIAFVNKNPEQSNLVWEGSKSRTIESIVCWDMAMNGKRTDTGEVIFFQRRWKIGRERWEIMALI
jgi:hypothetical protein